MNFAHVHAPSGTDVHRAEQAAAFDAYIQQDPYLSKHRGEYAERGAVFLPLVKRMDLSLTQDIFGAARREAPRRPDPARHHQLRQPAEPRTGASASALIQNQILTNARGRRAGPRHLPDGGRQRRAGRSSSLQTTAGSSDVYALMLSFRYTFQ